MILITGGAGYIGSHTNKLLSKKGLETLILDNISYGHNEFLKWGKFVHGDITDSKSLDEVFKHNDIKAVIHFAAFTYVGESSEDPAKYYRNNVFGTMNLLDAMVKYNVKNIVFSSSCAVYGNAGGKPISENTPKAPVSPYAVTKAVIEDMLKDYSAAYGIRYAVMRYFNAAGADPESEIGEWHVPEFHLIPLVFDAATKKRDCIKVFGNDYNTPDGTCIRDYIHVSDLAVAHDKALDYIMTKNMNGYFNIGSAKGYSVLEVIEAAKRATGKDIKTLIDNRRAGDPEILIADNSYVKKVLNFVPKYDNIDIIVEHAWRWYQRLQTIIK